MKSDDSLLLTLEEYARIRRHASQALIQADALNRFPTPVADIMAAAQLIVGEEELSEHFIESLRRKAVRVGKVLKSAISKVVGVFDPGGCAVYVAKGVHLVRQVFVKLHETGHALLPWHRDIYYAIQDCEKTLAPEVSEAFEREANIFASEVLFQLDVFASEAADFRFGLNVPLKLSKKYGASVYATIRRYVSTSHRNCAVMVLNPPELLAGDGFRCCLRRVITSKSFVRLFGRINWPEVLTPSKGLGRLIPMGNRRMSRPVTVRLTNMNGTNHECVAEAFRNKYYTFILIHEISITTRTIIT